MQFWSNSTINTVWQESKFQESVWSKSGDIQFAGVPLKIRSRSPNSDHFIPTMFICEFGHDPPTGLAVGGRTRADPTGLATKAVCPPHTHC